MKSDEPNGERTDMQFFSFGLWSFSLLQIGSHTIILSPALAGFSHFHHFGEFYNILCNNGLECRLNLDKGHDQAKNVLRTTKHRGEYNVYSWPVRP
jgi:hypothetical protein